MLGTIIVAKFLSLFEEANSRGKNNRRLDDPRPALKSLSIDQVRGQYCVPGGYVADKTVPRIE